MFCMFLASAALCRLHLSSGGGRFGKDGGVKCLDVVIYCVSMHAVTCRRPGNMSGSAMVYTAVSFYMDWICISVTYLTVSDDVISLSMCRDHEYIYKVVFISFLASQTFSKRAKGVKQKNNNGNGQTRNKSLFFLSSVLLDLRTRNNCEGF